MKEVKVAASRLKLLTWPDRCIGCGVELVGSRKSTGKIPVSSFLSRQETTIKVKLCENCGRKISLLGSLPTFGLSGAVVTLLYSVIAVVLAGVVLLLLGGQGAVYLLAAAIIGGFVLNGTVSKDTVGASCNRTAKGKWTFLFRDDVFATDFVNANAQFIEN